MNLLPRLRRVAAFWMTCVYKLDLNSFANGVSGLRYSLKANANVCRIKEAIDLAAAGLQMLGHELLRNTFRLHRLIQLPGYGSSSARPACH